MWLTHHMLQGQALLNQGGVSPQELFCTFDLLQGWNVVGCDYVELAPVYDRSGITVLLAAKLVREGLLAISRKLPTAAEL